MKILGFSLVTLFWLFFFFWLGTRFSTAFGSLPIIGK